MKGPVRDEKGAALLLAVILLLVGGLISAALLGHMGTGILAGEVYDTKTAELYAADAGVEDAVLKIQNQVEEVAALHCPGNHTLPYTIADVNGKGVSVSITLVRNETSDRIYSITSIATTPDTNSQTTIESYVKYTPATPPPEPEAPFGLDIFGLPVFGGALASSNTGTKNPLHVADYCTINGDIYHCGTFAHGSDFSFNGVDRGCGLFPNQGQVSNLTQTLKEQAQAGRNLTGTFKTSLIATNGVLNSTYINGSLTIDSDFALAGTVYVTGTITAALDHITITGSGSLFAVGKIAFFGKKYLTYDVTDSIIMSLSTDDAAIKFGAYSFVRALIYAPYGRIWFDGVYITVVGSAVGDRIENNQDHCTFNPKAEPPGGLPASLEIITYTVNPQSD